jgi:plastocyanin
MIYKPLCIIVGVLAQHVTAAPTAPVEDAAAVELETAEEAGAAQRRELFPLYSVGTRCARRGCSVYHQINSVNPTMSLADQNGVKSPVKALEMLALNDDMNTVVYSDSMCTRRQAMARAAGLAAGLSLSAVSAPGFAAETKMVKMGADSGQLVFVPDELKICKGDSVSWTNNKGGPHNVIFDDEASPSDAPLEALSNEDYVDEGKSFTKKFDVAGTYGYYCAPHRGAGMAGELTVA